MSFPLNEGMSACLYLVAFPFFSFFCLRPFTFYLADHVTHAVLLVSNKFVVAYKKKFLLNGLARRLLHKFSI